jgi:hypothetical protein
MRVDEKEHPDQLSDWDKFKKTDRGGNQALEDKALDAYFKVFADGGNEDEAKAAYFNVYKLNRKK